jgi:hypothetical protein
MKLFFAVLELFFNHLLISVVLDQRWGMNPTESYWYYFYL